MSKDKFSLLLLWLIMAGVLFKCIPQNKTRHGILAFFYMQTLTWFWGLVVTEKGLIKYPVRFFKQSNKSSFSFEYFIFPAMCSIFNIFYPKGKNKFFKLLYYILHSGIITAIEVMMERFTNLIEYKKWKWYWSFLTIGISYYSSRLFYRWFFSSASHSFENPSSDK
ncbi:CBO0543 family protein [Alkalihalobacillus deserti]|uniref:CBO0543 family protein n=1 Tax=Alkalihalobacillus deserti TaxID=2879466 RepID=UPI001D156DF4|nr:CBO0543 family protein [Alkalihalobacillus deserti]